MNVSHLCLGGHGILIRRRELEEDWSLLLFSGEDESFT